MALRLTLKPHERVILGGAVIRNGSVRAELLLENEVPILREPDILSPDAARTPCARVVLAIQLMYVDPARAAQHLETYRALVAEVVEAAPSLARLIAPIEECVNAGRLYHALKRARALIDHEREMLSNAA